MRISKIKFFDMFAGIGGFRAGLSLIDGYECVGHCEINEHADKSYRAVHNPSEKEWYAKDARTIEPGDMPDFDLLCGGFPCQAFSNAGLRGGFADPRGTLFFEIARLARAKRPAYLLLENVPGLLSHDKGRTFAAILAALCDLGYSVEWHVLNSKDFGVPQSRRRVFLIGYLDERCAGKILPIRTANGKALVQLIGGSHGERVYDPAGLSCTLTADTGGLGGKTGLYVVGFRRKNDPSTPLPESGEVDGLENGVTQLSSFVDLCRSNAKLTDTARCLTSCYGKAGIGNHKAESSGVLLVREGTKKGYAEALPGYSILCSAFGVFYSNEGGDGMPMTDAIVEIDAGFKAGIDAKIAELSAGDYDTINVSYRGQIDGDSMNVNNWNDVLSVYAVMITTDTEAGTDVVIVTPEKREKLKSIFDDMNKVSYQTEVTTTEETVENEDGEEETVTKTTLNIYITYKSLTYEQAVDLYGFTDDQRKVLDEMMLPAYYSYFAALLGVDIYGGVNLTEIISNLPVGTMGAEVAKVAITKLGAPYVWGAKGPSKFDCSGFVYWSINEVDPDLGVSMRTNAAGQAKWCYTHDRVVGRSELQPGDLIFWKNLSCPGCSRWNEVHHTGIYIGDGKVIEASSSKGRVIIRDLWESPNYPIFMFGRPY